MRRPLTMLLGHLWRHLTGLSLAAVAAGPGVAHAQGFPAPFGPAAGQVPAQQFQPQPGQNFQPQFQQPPQQPGVEVLARGPVHEGFAATAEFPTPGPVVPRMPPDPVEELPPDQRPAGDNVQWIPGYWQYDEERSDFLWVSGFWRVPPPGHVWIPGSWRQAMQGGGFQWVSGFWQEPFQQQGARVEYLPPPPQLLEYGPAVPAPNEASIYVPGCWVFRERYVWRPGFWMDHRPGWVWVPAQYRWTPGGYLYVEGYWDYPLDTRGVLFAPVAFAPAVYNQGGFVYTPSFAVSQQTMVSALFVRRGFSSYFFGDYFEARYAQAGFDPWIGRPRGGFAVSVAFGRGPVVPDPLFSYYQASLRGNAAWTSQITEVYAGRYRGDIPRPPRTLVQQNVVVNNVTNVNNTVINNVVNNTVINNNNTTVVNNNTAVNSLAMVQPLNTIARANPNVAFAQVNQADRIRERDHARQLREVGLQRQRAETAIFDRGTNPARPLDQPRAATINVPQQVIARASAASVAPAIPTRVARPVAGQPSLTGQPAIPGNTVNPAGVMPTRTPLPTGQPPTAAAQQAPEMRPVPGSGIAPAAVAPRPTPVAPRPLPGQVAPTPTPVTPRPLPGAGIAPANVAPRPAAPAPRPVTPTPTPGAAIPGRAPRPTAVPPPAQVSPQQPPTAAASRPNVPPAPRLGTPPPMPRPMIPPQPPARTSVPPPAQPSIPAATPRAPVPPPAQAQPTPPPPTPPSGGRTVTPSNRPAREIPPKK